MRDAPVTLHTTDFRNAVELTIEAVVDAARKIILPAKTAQSSIEQARSYLNGRGIPFTLAPARPDAPLVLDIGGHEIATGFRCQGLRSGARRAGWTASP